MCIRDRVKAVDENGGKAARYFATDMCDGIAQGHDGINYSLAPVSYTHLDVYKRQVEVKAIAQGDLTRNGDDITDFLGDFSELKTSLLYLSLIHI